jgi:hypothetical protein
MKFADGQSNALAMGVPVRAMRLRVVPIRVP